MKVLNQHLLYWSAIQSILGGILHFDKHHVTNLILSRIEHSPLHSIGQPRHLRITLLSLTINKYQVLPTYFLNLHFKLVFLKCINHPAQACLFYLLRHIILEPPVSMCLLSHAVSEQKC